MILITDYFLISLQGKRESLLSRIPNPVPPEIAGVLFFVNPGLHSQGIFAYPVFSVRIRIVGLEFFLKLEPYLFVHFSCVKSVVAESQDFFESHLPKYRHGRFQRLFVGIPSLVSMVPAGSVPQHRSCLSFHEDPYPYDFFGLGMTGQNRQAASGCAKVVVGVEEGTCGWGSTVLIGKRGVYPLTRNWGKSIFDHLLHYLFLVSPLIAVNLHEANPSALGQKVFLEIPLIVFNVSAGMPHQPVMLDGHR